MKIWVGPVGQISRGHVLDVNKKPFEQALKDYDSQLYVKWNPKKLKGHGCWEIRRHPNKKSVSDIVVFEGNTIVDVKYQEVDLVHHVLDCAFLNYDQIRKVKSMDTWSENRQFFVDNMESKEAAYNEAYSKKIQDDLRYQLKDMKGMMSEFKEMVKSGTNPHLLAAHWGKQEGS